MPDIVINTGPIIGLTAAVGSLNFLDELYDHVVLPQEVYTELKAGGKYCPELTAISVAKCIQILPDKQNIPVFLKAVLDVGEASVIQTALVQNKVVVAIDEKQGRHIARLHGLKVTGSIGILIKAKKCGLITDLSMCFQRMKAHGVWISASLQEKALKAVQEDV